MQHVTNYYADRLGNISIVSGIVRMDFLAVKSVDNQSNEVELAQSFRLAMPLDGVMQAIDMLEKMKAELVQQAQAAQQKKQTPAN